MSEHQIYKFKSVDRPLSREERKEINSWSSRTTATSSSATFTYHYGDFPKSPKQVLKDYFDIFLYFSNWGSKQLMIKLPLSLIDYKAISSFDVSANSYGSAELELLRTGGDLILNFELSDEEGGEWYEEDDFDMSDFVAIRESILKGDYSALYLYWLKISEMQDDDYYDDDDYDTNHVDSDIRVRPSSPPIPPELRNISASLQHFIDFFEIDIDMAKAAQSLSKQLEYTLEKPKDYKKLIQNLSEEEKEDFIFRLLQDEPRLSLTLKKHLDSSSEKENAQKQYFSISEIKAEQLKVSSERLKSEQEASRIAYLKRMNKLEKEVAILWKSVHFNLNRKTGKSYDLAVEILKDLKELAIYKNELTSFYEKMKQIKLDYKRSNSLKRRFDKAKL